MPASYVSPGLYTREIDESLFVPALADTPFGVVGLASWGPIAGDPDDAEKGATLVTTGGQLNDAFGPPTGIPMSSYNESMDQYPSHPMNYAAARYLRAGRRCYVVRVADLNTAAKAYGYLKGRSSNRLAPVLNTTGPVPVLDPTSDSITSAVVSTTGGSLPADTYYIKVTYVNSRGETKVGSAAHTTSLTTGTTSSILVTLGAFKSAVTNISSTPTSANIYVGTSDGNEMLVKEDVASGGTYNILALPVNYASNVYKITAKYKGVLGNRIRIEVSSGSDSKPSKPTNKYTISIQSPITPNISSKVEIFDGVTADPTSINADGSSNDALKRININTSKFVSLDLISPKTTGDALSDVLAAVAKPVTNSAAFTADAASGTLLRGNQTTGKIFAGISYNGSGGGETEILSSTELSLTSTNKAVKVTVPGTIPAPAPISTTVKSVNIYLGHTVNSTSASSTELRLVKTIPIASWIANATFALNMLPGEQTPENTAINANSLLTKGANGDPALDATSSVIDALYIGTVQDSVTPATGLQVYRDTESVSIGMIAVPGIFRSNVVAELIDVAERREDCLAIVDPPSFQGGVKTANDVIKWHNGLSGIVGAPTTALNSSYASLFWPWAQVTDGLNQQKLYIPPSGIAAETIARSDYNSEQWFAPAGLVRGMVSNIQQMQYRPSQGERDALYSGGNAVNPITTFTGTGIAIWGQRTLQRAPTALDRINVRRLVIFLRKVINRAAISFVFEPNDPTLWRKITGVLSPVLDGVQARRGIVSYKVVMDATTNTPDIIEQNMAVGNVYIKPTKTAEIIVLNFVVTSQSSTFNEFTAANS